MPHLKKSIQQKPDEALQTYNSRYESHFCLAYPDITIDNAGSRTQCIHYTSSLHGKLGNEIEGMFNQDLPDSLQAAFKKAMNFKPRILTKQNINMRRMNLKSMRPTYETLIRKVRIMTPTIKIKTKTIIIIIPAAVQLLRNWIQ